MRACVVAALLLLPAAGAADAHVLRLSFARGRSQALLHRVIAAQHAQGGKITSCYRVSDHAVRCGYKTWRRTGSPRFTCFGHFNSFFAPPRSNRVVTQSRGTFCR